MTKSEFLDKLKAALTGKVSDAVLREDIVYYNEYIDSQIRSGRSEAEVMEMLGDPRLIARTIVQTNGSSGTEEIVYGDGSAYQDGNAYRNSSYEQADNNTFYDGQRGEMKVRTIPGWVWAVVAIVLLVLVLNLVFSLVSFLLPVVLPIIVVMFFVKLFRDWLN